MMSFKLQSKKEKAMIRPGRLVKIIETHFGVGDEGKTYLLHPGNEGLVVQKYDTVDTLLLLITGDLVEVQEYAVELTNEWN